MKIETKGDFSIEPGVFKGTLESLGHFQCPQWFQDAKFGIWSHWGPQSVPMYGDWYARNMYLEGTDQYYYHWRTYGHPSRFGYKDIVKQWKAEKFDAYALMQLYVDAGAKYFVSMAMHHDNFDLFDSTYQPRFNSVKTGPNSDIVGQWKSAAVRHGLRFGVSEHLAGSPGFFHPNKGCDSRGPYKGVPYDGNDPEYFDLYYDQSNADSMWEKNWFSTKPEFYQHWFLRMKDLVDKYQPDMVYTDGPIPCETYGLDLVAHLYNQNAAKNNGVNQAVFTQKNRYHAMRAAGILDIEVSQEDKLVSYPWQTDTSVGDWFYRIHQKYKSWESVIESLVDNVSKNGNLLLNIPQRPDGMIDEECTWILKKISQWMRINSEGIHGTRPFRICGEGSGGFRRATTLDENDPEWKPAFGGKEYVSWNNDDVRFTQKGENVYAFLMRWPGELAIIRSLPIGKEPVDSVQLLGSGPLKFRQTGAGLLVDLPATAPSEVLNCLKITVK